MTTQTFSLSGAIAESSTLTVAAGETKVRVRFTTTIPPQPEVLAQLRINVNSTNTLHPIDARQGWASFAVTENDVVSVVVENRGNKTVAGIIESF